MLWGEGAFNQFLPELSLWGQRFLLITGKKSYQPVEFALMTALKEQNLSYKHITVTEEPTPEIIDQGVSTLTSWKPDFILAIGGGSVLDSAKAIGAMLCQPGSVRDYLEGVGHRGPTGKTLPVIAVPTTSGTGSEATKNAVLRSLHSGAFKKSLRHDNYIPHLAILDSQLLTGCPRNITIQSGLDAFTQLLESHMSTKANWMTLPLSTQGLQLFLENFPRVLLSPEDKDSRLAVGMASYLSGITLANAGLGTVHGMAGVLGGRKEIPHGLACSILIPPVFRITFSRLIQEDSPLLKRLEPLLPQLGSKRVPQGAEALIKFAEDHLKLLEHRQLSSFGFTQDDIPDLLQGWGNKNNPVKLDNRDMEKILQELL